MEDPDFISLGLTEKLAKVLPPRPQENDVIQTQRGYVFCAVEDGLAFPIDADKRRLWMGGRDVAKKGRVKATYFDDEATQKTRPHSFREERTPFPSMAERAPLGES